MSLKWSNRLWAVLGLVFVLIGIAMLVFGQVRNALIWFGATALWAVSLWLRGR